MKRKFLVVFMAIVTAFCMAFSLVGCGEKSDETGNNPPITDPSGEQGNQGSQGGMQKPDEGEQGGTQKPDDGEQGGTQKPDEGEQGGTQKPDESEQGGTQKPDEGGQEPETYTEGLCFTEMYGEDGTTVIGYSVGAGEAADEEEIVIPSKYNNLPVLSISRSVDDKAFWDRLDEMSEELTEMEQRVLLQKYTFAYLANLKKITIPDSVTSIGSFAFYQCIGLTSITIPHSVTLIRNSAFEGCYKLIEVWNYSDLQIEEDSGDNGGVGKYALNIYTTNEKSKQTKTDDGYLFYEDGTESYLLGHVGTSTKLTLPAKSPTGKDYEIYQYAFYNCNKLNSVTIPDSVTLIGDDAFYWCSGLTSLIIGKGVKEIGDNAFEGCVNLVEVWNYSDLQIKKGSFWVNGYVGHYAKYIYTTNEKSKQTKTDDGYIFYEHGTESYLLGYFGTSTELILPAKSPQGKNYEIYLYAFWNCNELISVTIGSGVTSIGYGAFWGCSGLTSVTIPDSVNSIKDNAFYNCSGLISISIPNSVTSIEDDTFYGCSRLTSVTIPDSVTSIGGGAFWGCSGLTSITIPNNVTSIGRSAFGGCSNLKEVHFKNPNGWKAGSTSLSGLDDPATAAEYLTGSYYYDYWKREG